ncbi:nuclear transport factor 2 family protein [Luteimonas sp. RIT-PG2_3]
MLSLVLLAGLGSGVAALADETAVDPIAAFTPEQLRDVIRQHDEALFAAVFETCDLAALRALVTDDLEFYHDKGGFTARSGQAFVHSVAEGCRSRAQPDSWRSRRELVVDSLRVYPVPGYGAIEVGTHRFHERQGDGPEALAGSADFSHVWRYADGRWQVSRVLSYAHR